MVFIKFYFRSISDNCILNNIFHYELNSKGILSRTCPSILPRTCPSILSYDLLNYSYTSQFVPTKVKLYHIYIYKYISN